MAHINFQIIDFIKLGYQNKEINQSDVSSNQQRQEEIKNGWFNTINE